MGKQRAMMVAVVAFFAVGCGGAQLVQQSTVGGRAALHGGYMTAMAEARLLAAEHCGGHFVALEKADGLRFTCSSRDLESPVAGAKLVALAR